ncbi:hypothetical protein ACQPYK_29580 [Streptosporangium sp. CA-135522]|uniref:hypothetical protein n=1 Tax=Streptosporangium sp. CA-135522 TaxID=3240072 RepID=UPI003D89E42A
MPYLTVEICHYPAHWTSPPYRRFKEWAAAEGIPEESGHYLEVWDGSPVRAVLNVYDLDGNGDKIDDGNGGYVTHPITYTASTLPPVQGQIVGGAR